MKQLTCNLNFTDTFKFSRSGSDESLPGSVMVSRATGGLGLALTVALALSR